MVAQWLEQLALVKSQSFTGSKPAGEGCAKKGIWHKIGCCGDPEQGAAERAFLITRKENITHKTTHHSTSI